jgi:hypothetical protein
VTLAAAEEAAIVTASATVRKLEVEAMSSGIWMERGEAKLRFLLAWQRGESCMAIYRDITDADAEDHLALLRIAGHPMPAVWVGLCR